MQAPVTPASLAQALSAELLELNEIVHRRGERFSLSLSLHTRSLLRLFRFLRTLASGPFCLVPVETRSLPCLSPRPPLERATMKTPLLFSLALAVLCSAIEHAQAAIVDPYKLPHKSEPGQYG